MDLSPYLESLRRDFVSSAAPGGEDVTRTAELLAGSIEAAIRLSMMEVLSAAADEITDELDKSGHPATVEVRMRGREADLVVTDAPATVPTPPPTSGGDSGDVARITLRLPEALKEAVEQAASAESISVNAWLVRAINASVHGGPPTGSTTGRARFGRRITGYAQA